MQMVITAMSMQMVIGKAVIVTSLFYNKEVFPQDLSVVLITFEAMYILQQFGEIVIGLQELDLVKTRCMGAKPDSVYLSSGYYSLEVGYRKIPESINLDWVSH